MLSRQYRLRRRNDFSRVFRRGKVTHSRSFSLKYDHNHLDHSRIAAVISTKISKKAVARNRLRRQLYAQARQLLPNIAPGYDIVILVRTSAIGKNGNDLGSELLHTLGKAGLIESQKPKT